ncbi:MAG: WYL domain-containing protein [Bacteroidales bacterium]|nr:WYL domain-containing protein [Lentimicrobiaceae bacterium]MDD5695288.1 WYL domain-containing protein [Bacteroidales bacterium]
MPKNKEALIRYRVINRYLIDHTYATRAQLIKACEDALDIAPLGERTIAGDIHAMRYDRHLGYYAPICYDQQRKAYYYDHPDYSIDNLPINSDEMDSLRFASAILNQFKHVDVFAKYSGALQKVVDLVTIQKWHDRSAMEFIELEKVPFVKGSEYLEFLLDAIRDKTVLTIQHQPFDAEEPFLHTVHPYHLKEYRNRWYLIGYDEQAKDIRIFGLDRIQSVCQNPDLNFISRSFETEDYFRNTIGIFTTPGAPVRIVLRFTKPQGKYLLTQSIHESQQVIEETRDHIDFGFCLNITSEFISFILGWGASVKVISPAALAETVKKELEKTLGIYDEE